MKTFALVLLTLILAGTTSVFAQDQMKHDEKKSGHKFAVKELKVFHDVLHPLVHDALPNGNFEKIRTSLEKLLAKAVAIQKAKLPKELSGRKQEFDNTCDSLVRQLEEMNTMKNMVDDKTLEKAFNGMHETFEQLAEIAR